MLYTTFEWTLKVVLKVNMLLQLSVIWYSKFSPWLVSVLADWSSGTTFLCSEFLHLSNEVMNQYLKEWWATTWEIPSLEVPKVGWRLPHFYLCPPAHGHRHPFPLTEHLLRWPPWLSVAGRGEFEVRFSCCLYCSRLRQHICHCSLEINDNLRGMSIQLILPHISSGQPIFPKSQFYWILFL